MTVIVVMPPLGIHVAENIFKALQREAERKDPRLGLVDNPCDTFGFGVNEYVYLTQVLVTKNKREGL